MDGRQEFELYLRGSLRLRTTDPPTRVRGEKILASYRLRSNPNWRFILRSDQSPEKVFQWLVAKRILSMRFSRVQEILLFWLAAERSDWTQLLLLLERRRKSKDQNFPCPHTKERTSDLRTTAKRILRSYKPQIYPYREWFPLVITPVRRIGVGYKDKGTLSSAPSWKDQILYTEDNSQETLSSTFLQSLLLSLRSTPDIAD